MAGLGDGSPVAEIWGTARAELYCHRDTWQMRERRMLLEKMEVILLVILGA